jgi:hypothetical protein
MENEVENQIEKTSRGLAGAMFEELELLRAGKSTPQQARAKASIANTVCTISRLEMDFARFVSSARAEEDVEHGMKALPMG